MAVMAGRASAEESVGRAHQRARNEAISAIDTEVQRLTYCYLESGSAPVREAIGRRVRYLEDLMDRLTGWRYD